VPSRLNNAVGRSALDHKGQSSCSLRAQGPVKPRALLTRAVRASAGPAPAAIEKFELYPAWLRG
jgi:hypothetical protein